MSILQVLSIFFIKNIGETIEIIVVKIHKDFQYISHSTFSLLVKSWNKKNKIAVNPGIKTPITQEIKVGFKKLNFIFFSVLV